MRKNMPWQWLVETIENFTVENRDNTLGLPFHEKAFDRPLVGFSNGADPVYKNFKDHIGSFYCTPCELFEKTFPGSGANPKDLVVISWIIPSTLRTRTEQAEQKRYPSERWARTRSFGEDFNNALRRMVVEELRERSIPALAPILSPFWSRYDQGPYAPCSNWSERHAAYAGGLGTFGLCDGLITLVGKAVRVGSVIALLDIPPSPRPYSDHHAYCLHYTHDTCRECISRCPVNAISEKGHDKKRCMQYTEETMNKYIHDRYNLDTYACGLCQAGVPCTEGIPDAQGYMKNQSGEKEHDG
ncbi:MAG: epoxyqueuosine reductase [Desulfobulbaceae bacterium]|nr:epoxyqueuosine reductase [Desulfobulbaceae bacterium]